MRAGPDIARVAALLGDPARANMLTALLDGGTLTAGELARQAGVTAQTASSHLARLQDGGLVASRRQGRHHYFSLSDHDVGAILESLMGLADRIGHQRARPGPKDPALRQARVCYDHLAGTMAVAMLDSMLAQRLVHSPGDDLVLTDQGSAFIGRLGIDLPFLARSRRPLCRTCLDWSVRRPHLAGGLGAALLTRFSELGWASRQAGSRVVTFTPLGQEAFARLFPPAA
ncbi:ArsR/SmtB family transcription factor [Geminicoccus roseus]|uniref:ArsR/SmtB family transcription factor n=1 Tax=Geminicoccus roseus TaxID=404900 RepID=UPI0004297324|nr:helix-turn-helix transcriptional regulator [Geminicoccus roseus]